MWDSRRFSSAWLSILYCWTAVQFSVHEKVHYPVSRPLPNICCPEFHDSFHNVYKLLQKFYFRLFIFYFSFFNADTFSSNTLLIKITKFQHFVNSTKILIITRLINISHTRNKGFVVTRYSFTLFHTRFEKVWWMAICNALRKILPNLRSSERDCIDVRSSSKFSFRNQGLCVF